MRNYTVVIAVLILICTLALVGIVTAANGFVLGRSVIGGGGQEAAGGSYVINGTVSEPIAGELHIGPSYGLRSGFWQPNPGWQVFLPLVSREVVP